MREKWRKIIAKNRNDKYYKPNDTSIVCSKHFLESELYITKKGFRRLKRSAYPRLKVTEKPECVNNAEKVNLPIVSVNIPSQCNDSMDAECSVKDEKDLDSKETTVQIDIEESLSGTSSVSDTPKTKHLKKELKKCHNRISMKNRQIDNLKKQNKRLIKKNQCFKKIIQDLKKFV